MTGRLRHLAAINPPVPGWEQIPNDQLLTFVPLEAVWPRQIDFTRQRSKSETSTGYTRFLEGDVIVPKITPTFEADRSTWVNRSPTTVLTGTTELHVVRPGPRLEPRYLDYVFSSSFFLQDGESQMVGVAGQKRIPDEWLRNYRMPMVDLDTQHKIADYLDTETARIDTLISKKRRLIHLFEARTRHTARTLTFERGVEAPLRRFISLIKTGTTPPLHQLADLMDDQIAWISPVDMDYSLEMKEPSRRLAYKAIVDGWCPSFPPESTVIVGIGATVGRVGHNSAESTGNQQITCIKGNELVLPKFLSWQLWARSEELRKIAPYTTLPILNNEFLLSLPFFAPTRDLQHLIVDQLDQIASHTTKARQLLQRQVELLEEHRQTLITAVVTGEMPVPGVAK